MKIEHRRPFKKHDIDIDNSELANPFFEFNGWNGTEEKKMNLYKSWFKSCLSSQQQTKFKQVLSRIWRINILYGKVTLCCSCEGKSCISKIVKNYFENGGFKNE